MKGEKGHMTGGKKPTNTWEYWKLTPLNKWRWKKKLRKSISGEPESYSRQNYVAEILL